MKKNLSLLLIILATVALGVIAVLISTKLYQTRKEPIAPTAPKPAPAAEPQCRVTFMVSSVTTPTPGLSTTPTTTPRVTPTPTATGSPAPTPTPPPGCFLECSSDSQCQGSLRCLDYGGAKRCLNPLCSSESDCTCNKNCWDVCGHDSECPSGLSCLQTGATKRCINSSCKQEQDCDCSVVTPPPPTPSAYVAKVDLPEVGFTLPTAGAIIGGISFVVLSLFLLL